MSGFEFDRGDVSVIFKYEIRGNGHLVGPFLLVLKSNHGLVGLIPAGFFMPIEQIVILDMVSVLFLDEIAFPLIVVMCLQLAGRWREGVWSVLSGSYIERPIIRSYQVTDIRSATWPMHCPLAERVWSRLI